MSEKRSRAPRHVVHVPATIGFGEGEVRHAMTHDGSLTGLQLLTPGQLEPGQKVTIRCLVSENTAVVVEGMIVREERLGPEEIGLWQSKISVKMDKPSPEIAEKLEGLAEEEARKKASKNR